ncbi:uncharacterized protein LOC111278425 [Durio zibethinus]|uniref:Uncharacterized protein LOC111278425 n=1 Tax=Durio zibethinus TaxID=66656 RepID=A0A6P5WXH5_DURZI|nr:uncharacterized protein LOC111278425 [Durio zibethinus]
MDGIGRQIQMQPTVQSSMGGSKGIISRQRRAIHLDYGLLVTLLQKVAVYAMLKTAIEVEILLSQERHNNPSPVRKILTQETDLLEEFIESQLKLRHSDLVQWFRVVELPRIAGFFIPLLKKWSMEYAGSGVAGIIMAISCCAAVEKLGSELTSCPLSKMSISDVLVELMNLSHSNVSVDKLHQLATLAGFEIHFLSHFGANFLSSKKSDELEFWIGLAQRKLSVAFCKETMIPGKLAFNSKVQADRLATLGLFAYLGRKTRLFLSQLRINDLDELLKDFLRYYKRCTALAAATWSVAASSFTQSSLPYQFTNSSWSRSAQQPLDSELLAFLLRR